MDNKMLIISILSVYKRILINIDIPSYNNDPIIYNIHATSIILLISYISIIFNSYIIYIRNKIKMRKNKIHPHNPEK